MAREAYVSSEPALPVLAYSGQRSCHRRWMVASLLTIFVVAAGLSWYRWRGAIRSRYDAWQQLRADARQFARCLAYSAPRDQVVYEENPARASDLHTLSETHTIQTNWLTYTNTLSEGDLTFELQIPVARTPALWLEFARRVALSPVHPGTALLFMHQRTSANGTSRLVCVGADFDIRQITPDRNDLSNWGMARQIRAWTVAANPKDRPSDYVFDVGYLYIRTEGDLDIISQFDSDPARPIASPFPMRFFAGQPDPADASRFTLEYQLEGIDFRGRISGVLQDDGEVWFSPDIGRTDGVGRASHWYLDTSSGTLTKRQVPK